VTEAQTISKDKALPESQDYEKLREAGVEYIRKLAGSVWTDHNTHDPGITALEVLCYALTDLGYRTGFPIEDLLTDPDTKKIPDASETGLFEAHDILPCAPLTIADYRRMLIRIAGVRNAWLDPLLDGPLAASTEPSIFADCASDTLTYNSENPVTKQPNRPVRVSGLYRVMLELETDTTLGTLNELRLVYRVPRGGLEGVTLWLDSEQAEVVGAGVVASRSIAGLLVEGVDPGPARHLDLARVKLTLDDGSEFRLGLLVMVDQDPGGAVPKDAALRRDKIDTALTDAADDGPVKQFWAKLAARQTALARARCALHAYRNLCEDYLSLGVVEPQHIAVCADVEVDPSADLEEVQAAVFHAIEQVLNPPIPRYTLEEMLGRGLQPDEIFNGPYFDAALTHDGEAVFTRPGFVLDDDLAAADLPTTVHTSDLINAIMDLEAEGAVAIRNVLLRPMRADGTPAGPSQRWCLPVERGRQPRLMIERSRLLFHKQGLPYLAEPDEFADALDRLRALARRDAYVDPDQHLETPTGRARRTEAFYSVQDDFPATYGVGQAGLPRNAGTERDNQARQFKAYLTVFDQVLADYLSQLANARRLLSLDGTLTRTYFSQYLAGIAGVRDEFGAEFYADPAWMQDDNNRASLTESESGVTERRNRFLDHLLARFAERFTDYAMLQFRLDGDPLHTGSTLIDDKIRFLGEYPSISRLRHTGFNQRPDDPARIWDSDNVSGLERRVARLLGIDDFTRRDLACTELFGLLFSAAGGGADYRVEIAGDAGTLFRSKEIFGSESDALDAARRLSGGIRLRPTYRIVDLPLSERVGLTIEHDGLSLSHDGSFETEVDAVAVIRAIVERHDALLLGKACDREGMHLIEHLLLRPRVDGDARLPVCLGCYLNEGKPICRDDDPYSFRITVALPYWPERFTNLYFREFVERTIREETPAHIHAKICWISNEQMALLDARHRAWREGFARDPLSAAARAAADDLVELLASLKSVYPAATLHDCADDGDDGIVVRLGTTNLGFF